MPTYRGNLCPFGRHFFAKKRKEGETPPMVFRDG